MTSAQDIAARELIQFYADTLEATDGPCLAGRDKLMAWLNGQFIRLAKVNAPDDAAHAMIRNAYLQWQAELDSANSLRAEQ